MTTGTCLIRYGVLTGITRWPRTLARRPTSVRQLADRLDPLLARGDIALVLGGNCTIALGVMAALRRLDAGRPDCCTSTAITTSTLQKAPRTGRWTGWG